MMRKNILLLTTVVAFLFTACKDKSLVDATIINTGDITYEGCGYLLELENSELLQPLYLPGAYQHNGLQVKVKYSHTGVQDTCEYGTVIYDLIDIEKIERAN